VVLTQQQADDLLALAKRLTSVQTINFPAPGSSIELDATDTGKRESFIIDVQRKGRIKITKCTYQERTHGTEILLRLDVDGPPHDNPDGATILCPHMHVYQEGYDDKWAHPIETGHFDNTSDLAITLKDFLKYCKISPIPQVQPAVL
jgi:hypothetical protein